MITASPLSSLRGGSTDARIWAGAEPGAGGGPEPRVGGAAAVSPRLDGSTSDPTASWETVVCGAGASLVAAAGPAASGEPSWPVAEPSPKTLPYRWRYRRTRSIAKGDGSPASAVLPEGRPSPEALGADPFLESPAALASDLGATSRPWATRRSRSARASVGKRIAVWLATQRAASRLYGLRMS